MAPKRYSTNLLNKLRHLHDEMKECVAIFSHLNPDVDVRGWAEDELDAWGVWRCPQCDHVVPWEDRADEKCKNCAEIKTFNFGEG